jgi:hypothetical protein
MCVASICSFAHSFLGVDSYTGESFLGIAYYLEIEASSYKSIRVCSCGPLTLLLYFVATLLLVVVILYRFMCIWEP